MKRLLQHVTETLCVGTYQPSHVFIIESQEKREVCSFLGNDHRWYIRFCPTHLGTLQVVFDTQQKDFLVVPYRGTNPLYRHGPVTCLPNSTYLTHTDGTALFLLIDTWWFAMTKRTSDEQFAFLLTDRKKKGFNAIQFVVAYPPETATDSSDATNMGGFPMINGECNPAYFEIVDRRIQMMVEKGLVPVLYGSWGHHLDSLGKDHMKLLWKEILARYSEYPCILSVCGEVDVFLSPRQTQAQPLRQSLIKKQFALHLPTLYEKAAVPFFTIRAITHRLLEGKQLQLRLFHWNEVAEWIYLHHKRPMTIHVSRRERASKLFHNPQWLLIDSIQSGHTHSSLLFMREALEQAANDHKPIINLEPWYEGILNSFDAYHQRKAVWISLLEGAVGHGYGAHGLWQMATKEDRFMSHWGESEWKEAVHAPGATIVGKTVQFFIKHGGLQGRRLKFPDDYHLSTIHKPLWYTTPTHLIGYIPQKQYHTQSQFHLPFPLKVVYWYNPDTLSLIKKQNTDGKTISLQEEYFQEQDLLILATRK